MVEGKEVQTMAQRQIKMNRNDKSILIRALHASYRAQKEQGQPRPAEGDLLLRIHATEPGRLSLNDEEYHMAFSALNRLRNERLATGGCTDAADAALSRLAHVKQPCWLFRI